MSAEVDSIEVGTLSVLVEYGQELDRSAVRPDGVGRHGREVPRLTRFDEDLPVAQVQSSRAREHGGPGRGPGGPGDRPSMPLP